MRELPTGFTVVELVVAAAVFLCVLGAVVELHSGASAVVTNAARQLAALRIAEQVMADEMWSAADDFSLVNPEAYFRDDYYVSIFVDSPNPLEKKITVRVTWQNTHGLTSNISLTSAVTNFAHAKSGTACSSILSGDWSKPRFLNTQNDMGELVGDATGIYTISDLTVRSDRLYVAVNTAVANAKPTFFVFDVSDLTKLVLKASIDTSPAVSAGLNAVALSADANSTTVFVANGYRANYATCTNVDGLNSSCGQLQIFRATNDALGVVTTLKIPNVTARGGGIGNSLWYERNLVFLGLTATASHGPEFHIIDVHNPERPSHIGSWPAVGSLGHDINAIAVRGRYAYLLHPAGGVYNEQVTVLDVADPTQPVRVGSYYAPGGIGGNGKSLVIRGNTLYLGRTLTTTSDPEFIALDITDPTKIAEVPLSQAKIGSSINGLLVRDTLSFLATNSELDVRALDKPTNQLTALPFVSSGSSVEPSLTCQGNTLFISANDSSGRGKIMVIGPTP